MLCRLAPALFLLGHITVVLSGQSSGHQALQVLEKLGFVKDTTGAEVTVGQGKRRGDSPIYYIKLPPLPYYYAQQNALQPTPHPFQQLSVDFTSNGRPDQIYHWNIPPTTPHYWPQQGGIQPINQQPIIEQYPILPPPGDQQMFIPQDPIGNVVIPQVGIQSPSGNQPNWDIPVVNQDPIQEPSFDDQFPYIPPSIISPVQASGPYPQGLEDPIPGRPLELDEPQESNQNFITELVDSPKIPILPLKSPTMKPTPSPILSNDILGIPSKNPTEKKKPWLQIGKEKGMYVYNGRPSNIYIWRPKPLINPLKYKHPLFYHFNY